MSRAFFIAVAALVGWSTAAGASSRPRCDAVDAPTWMKRGGEPSVAAAGIGWVPLDDNGVDTLKANARRQATLDLAYFVGCDVYASIELLDEYETDGTLSTERSRISSRGGQTCVLTGLRVLAIEYYECDGPDEKARLFAKLTVSDDEITRQIGLAQDRGRRQPVLDQLKANSAVPGSAGLERFPDYVDELPVRSTSALRVRRLRDLLEGLLLNHRVDATTLIADGEALYVFPKASTPHIDRYLTALQGFDPPALRVVEKAVLLDVPAGGVDPLALYADLVGAMRSGAICSADKALKTLEIYARTPPARALVKSTRETLTRQTVVATQLFREARNLLRLAANGTRNPFDAFSGLVALDHFATEWSCLGATEGDLTSFGRLFARIEAEPPRIDVTVSDLAGGGDSQVEVRVSAGRWKDVQGAHVAVRAGMPFAPVDPKEGAEEREGSWAEPGRQVFVAKAKRLHLAAWGVSETDDVEIRLSAHYLNVVRQVARLLASTPSPALEKALTASVAFRLPRTRAVVAASLPEPRRMLVIHGTYDNIQAVLEERGFTDYTVGSPAALDDPSTYSLYDYIFINCSNEMVASRGASLRAWVEKGGTLYASDWAYEYVQANFPGAFYFPRRPKVGEAGHVTVISETPGIVPHGERRDVAFDLAAWVTISGIDRRRVEPLYCVDRGSVDCRGAKMIGGIMRYGKGSMYFTSFHLHAQSSDVERELLRNIVTQAALENYTQPAIDVLRHR